MKALCPTCFGKGCDKCVSGYISASFAEGSWSARVCLDCRRVNGACVDSFRSTSEKDKPEPCVFCKSTNTEWQSVEGPFG